MLLINFIRLETGLRVESNVCLYASTWTFIRGRYPTAQACEAEKHTAKLCTS